MTQAMRRTSVRRRLRSLGGKVIRRFGMLPNGQPDGLGEDDALQDAVWDARVLVYFADTRDGLYQLEQWYGPLRALHDRMGVIVVCADSRTTAAVRERAGLPAVTIAQATTLERMVRVSGVRLALYVNYNPLNTLCLRFSTIVHASLLHGDSDKSVSVSNQVKAYDFSLVAGRAAIDRYRAHTMLFDAESRCLPIGRPQLDTGRLRSTVPDAGGVATVLYAPTWEGASDEVAYSSLASHGVALVRALLDAGVRVRYRPHPLTGVRLGEFGEADVEVRALLQQADQADPGTAVASTLAELVDDFVLADLLVADVSAVPMDWLPTGRPMVVTTPDSPAVRAASTPLLDIVPRIGGDDVGRLGQLVDELLAGDPAQQQRAELTDYYLGDTEPGAAMTVFLDTCERLARIAEDEARQSESS